LNKKKKVITWLGRILMVVSLGFVVRAVIQYDVDFSQLASPLVVAALLLLALLIAANVLFSSAVFTWLLGVISGLKINRQLSVHVFCSANLYKYLPGNVMHFVGRNRLAAETELTHPQVAFATVIDVIFLCIAAAIISVTSVAEYFLQYLSDFTIPVYLWIIAAVGLLLFVAACVVFRKKLRKAWQSFNTMRRRITVPAAIKLVLANALRLLVPSLTYVVTLMVLGQSITWGMLPRVVGLYAMSWVVGFLMPGAPGGLGVREFVMITFMGSELSHAILLSSVIIHRIIYILGDILAFGASAIYARRNKREHQ